MWSRSHNLGAELRLHSLTVLRDTSSNEVVAVVVPETSVEVKVTVLKAIIATFHTWLLKC